MTPNVNYFEQIEDYCLDLLNREEKLQFETELKLDAELRNEVKLRIEIQSAIEELDVITLRDKLKNVASHKESFLTPNNAFELLNDFSNFREMNDELSPEELIDFFDSMPKVHVHQHETIADENTHRFYKQQEKPETNGKTGVIDDFNFDEFKGLEEAILEKDIINLRHNLTQVAKSLEPQFSVEEIDRFINGELNSTELNDFERELANNQALEEELLLHSELEKAIQESEIIELRNQVSQIMKSETSWNVSQHNIESFIDGELDEAILEEFNAELEENQDLMAEVELRRQINEVVGESDIMKLRNELKKAKESAKESKVRNLIPVSNNKLYRTLRNSVAVILFLIGIGGVFNSGYLSVNKTYDNFFEPPSWPAERSVTSNLTLMKEAQTAYIEGDYTKVIELKTANSPTNRSSINPVLQFYVAASLQNTNDFTKAIEEYTKVINHGDNLFIEEARWYRSLCYMKLGNRVEARKELLAVVNKNGYFKPNAKAILRRLKFAPE